MNNSSYQIILPYATFGIITQNNIVVGTAPIGRWMLGKCILEIQTWVKNKGGSISIMK